MDVGRLSPSSLGLRVEDRAVIGLARTARFTGLETRATMSYAAKANPRREPAPDSCPTE